MQNLLVKHLSKIYESNNYYRLQLTVLYEVKEQETSTEAMADNKLCDKQLSCYHKISRMAPFRHALLLTP